jgi:hypothetical protein
MTKRITFDDGTSVGGESDDEIIRRAEAHIRVAYPTLAGQLSREEILAMAVQIGADRVTDREEDTMATTETTAGYDLEGTLLEACSCGVLCPCWIGEDPDGGWCNAFNAYHFERGTIRGVDVSGLSLVRVALIPGNVLTPKSWKQVLLVDDRASDEQADAIVDAYEGRLGGPLADLAGLVADTLAVERAAISHEINGGAGVLKVGDFLSSTMHPFQGPDGRTTTLRDSLFSTVPGSPAYVAVAETHEVALPQYGMEWSYDNRNAIQADYKISHEPGE